MNNEDYLYVDKENRLKEMIKRIKINVKKYRIKR